MATRECPNPDCDAEIGETETSCPKCQTVIADFEADMEAVDRASRALAKRNAKKPPAVPEVVPPAPETKKKTIFDNLRIKKA